MMQKKLTAKEVADQLRISVPTLKRFIQSGELRAARIGKNWRIDQKDVDAFYEDRIPTRGLAKISQEKSQETRKPQKRIRRRIKEEEK